MTGSVKLVSVALLGLAMTGCVAQEKYNALSLEADALREQLAIAAKDAAAAKAEAASYKSQLDLLNGGLGGAQGTIGSLTAQNAQLAQQLKEMQDRYNELLGKANNGGGALPAPLSNALEDLARAHPDLLEFDAARGIVRFKADVTFASGDATLTPGARKAVQEFADILNSQAKGYEFLVVGHTDNVTHFTPATVAKGHKNNWYLSSHRAISVAEVLIGSNVAASRLGVTGYADERPIASNTTEAGKAKNRRVEVVILPTTFAKSTASTADGHETRNGKTETGNKQ